MLAYAAKYASALYGPFREAADVTIVGGGDRQAYQQDYRNGREALAEVALDAVSYTHLDVYKRQVLRRLGHDKKAVGGEVRWVLLARRGEPVTDQRVPADLVRETLEEVLQTR